MKPGTRIAMMLIGIAIMLFSLACIISTVVDVARGKAGLFSVDAVGPYVFHPLAMLGALYLITAGRPRSPEPTKGPAPDSARGGA